MHIRMLLVLSVSAFGLVPAAASAQSDNAQADPAISGPGSAAAPRREAAEGGDIVVTAQRRSERLVDVPMSIAAIGGEELKASGISSTGALEQLTPGLVTPNVGLSFTPAIRGVTSVSTSPGDETNVALYLDDVYIGASIAGLFEFRDIERIEVLKGPQGTLFGRNATGGAIRVVTRAPSFTPSLELSADYGVNFDRWKLGGYATTPISDELAVSFALNFVDDNGFYKGVAQNAGRRYAVEKSISVRGKLLWQASDTMNWTFSADYSDQSNTGIYAWVPRRENFATRNTPGAVIGGDFEYSGSTQPLANLAAYGFNLTGEIDLGGGNSLRSITGFRSAEGVYQTDTDRINLTTTSLRLRQHQRNFSQELIFATPAEKPVSFVGGLYYYRARAWNPYFRAYTGDAPNAPIGTNFTNNVITNSYAAFGEMTYRPTERLHLAVGGRYTWEKKDIDFRFLQGGGLRSGSDGRTWRSATFRGVVQYDISDDANLYATVSNGFKSGVFNAYAFPLVAVEPEKIIAFEAGFKGKIGDLTATLAGFAYDYSNIQVQGQTQIGGVFVVTLTNAAKAKIRGIEATLGGRLGENFRFDLGGSWMPTARYSSYPNAQIFLPLAFGNQAVVPFDATGSRTIRSPRFEGNARIAYEAELAGGDFASSISVSHNSGFFFQPANLSRQKAYQVVNARIAWTEPSDTFTFSVSGENIFDEHYSFYTTDSLAGTVDVLARPREVYFGISAKF